MEPYDPLTSMDYSDLISNLCYIGTMARKIYFDGGCKPNPGMMEVCIVVVDGPNPPVPHVVANLGRGTNNIAEWSALLWAMSYAVENGWREIEVIGDSKLVVSQAAGRWQIKNSEFHSFKSNFDALQSKADVRLRHVLRNKNLAGKHLDKIH